MTEEVTKPNQQPPRAVADLDITTRSLIGVAAVLFGVSIAALRKWLVCGLTECICYPLPLSFVLRNLLAVADCFALVGWAAVTCSYVVTCMEYRQVTATPSAQPA